MNFRKVFHETRSVGKDRTTKQNTDLLVPKNLKGEE